ncbi:metal-dependent hydrolase [Pseudoalteromonas sp. B62]
MLGSAVAYATLGSKLGRKSLLIGAAFGTLPDLDVLINFGGDVENFVYHRSFSHSLFIQLLLSPLFAWLLLKMNWAKCITMTRWSAGIFLILSTHSLLDNFTVYGTQLLWPLSTYPFSISSIFIIDPAYTLPLVLSCIALCFARMRPHAQLINTSALVISLLYLIWGFTAKYYINSKIYQALNQKTSHSHILKARRLRLILCCGALWLLLSKVIMRFMYLCLMKLKTLIFNFTLQKTRC